MAGTFSSASHETDTRMRTDFKVIATYAKYNPAPNEPSVKIWMKNIGTSRIGQSEIENSDVFIGVIGNFQRAGGKGGFIQNLPIDPPVLTVDNTWSYSVVDTNGNGFWDTGETLEIDALSSRINAQYAQVYFQFVLPNGVWRSSEFTSS